MFENGFKFKCQTVSLEREMERKKAVKESMINETSDLVATNLHWETKTEHIIDYFRHLGELLQLEMESATAEREAKDASKREEEVENEEENTE